MLVLDSSLPLSAEDDEAYALTRHLPHAIVLNKSDLRGRTSEQEVLARFAEKPLVLSAKTGVGLDLLTQRLLDFAEGGAAEKSEVLINERHFEAVTRARKSLHEAIIAAEGGFLPDCCAIDLRAAWECLGEITGVTVDDAIVDRIFTRFCLGK